MTLHELTQSHDLNREIAGVVVGGGLVAYGDVRPAPEPRDPGKPLIGHRNINEAFANSWWGRGLPGAAAVVCGGGPEEVSSASVTPSFHRLMNRDAHRRHPLICQGQQTAALFEITPTHQRGETQGAA